MFEEFLKHGSTLGVLLMVYTNAIYYDVLLVSKQRPHSCPQIYNHPIATIFLFLGIPCVLWPSIYIGLFDGLIAGILFWVAQQIVAQLLISRIAGIPQGRPQGALHFILASIAHPIGYYLSLTNLPKGLL